MNFSFPNLTIDTVSSDHLPIFKLSGFVIIILTSLLLFPFFLFVQRQNREEDKKTSVYAIISHFNFIVKYINSMTLAAILGYLVYRVLEKYGWNVKTIMEKLAQHAYIFFPVVILGSIIMLIVLLPLCTIPSVQYVLHFLLALQRFLIYFFPDTESYVNLSAKKMKLLLYLLYPIAGICIAIAALGFQWGWISDQLISDQAITIVAIVLNALQLISVLFYIPIMISISKLTELVSAAIHRPQKYIFYQILTHFLSRLILVPILLDATETHLKLRFFFSYEVFLTPLTIQVAYLLCNRKNVHTMLSSPFLEILKPILFKNYKRAQVQPEEVIESTRV